MGLLLITAFGHGFFAYHGGYFPPQPNGGGLSSVVQSFSNGLRVGAVVNSPISGNPLGQTVVDAYNASWVPVY